MDVELFSVWRRSQTVTVTCKILRHFSTPFTNNTGVHSQQWGTPRRSGDTNLNMGGSIQPQFNFGTDSTPPRKSIRIHNRNASGSTGTGASNNLGFTMSAHTRDSTSVNGMLFAGVGGRFKTGSNLRSEFNSTDNTSTAGDGIFDMSFLSDYQLELLASLLSKPEGRTLVQEMIENASMGDDAGKKRRPRKVKRPSPKAPPSLSDIAITPGLEFDDDAAKAYEESDLRGLLPQRLWKAVRQDDLSKECVENRSALEFALDGALQGGIFADRTKKDADDVEASFPKIDENLSHLRIEQTISSTIISSRTVAATANATRAKQTLVSAQKKAVEPKQWQERLDTKVRNVENLERELNSQKEQISLIQRINTASRGEIDSDINIWNGIKTHQPKLWERYAPNRIRELSAPLVNLATMKQSLGDIGNSLIGKVVHASAGNASLLDGLSIQLQKIRRLHAEGKLKFDMP